MVRISVFWAKRSSQRVDILSISGRKMLTCGAANVARTGNPAATMTATGALA